MQDELDAIWADDLLDRRQEAARIEAYIKEETEAFIATGRNRSVVLAIDAPYGRGKSWFLERLILQLRMSHPVAFIDAWTEDVGDEPLAAFMVSIEDALAPFLSTKSKVKAKLQAAKSAAMPILGKIVVGGLTKAMTKLAGDEIDDQIGDLVDEAVRRRAIPDDAKEHATAAQAAEAGLEAAAKEIEALTDRRGATILAAYRQKRDSRVKFRKSMTDLVESLEEGEEDSRNPPLIVVIDELDRCRPIFAIRMLEEIKHFFEIKNVVFLISLYGNQLSKSVKSVYGAEFDSEEYLRRFFTRTYFLSENSVENLAISLFQEWKIDSRLFHYPNEIEGLNEVVDASVIAGRILHDLQVTPRETFHIFDCLRLFISRWNHSTTIDLIAIIALCIKIVRNDKLDFSNLSSRRYLIFKGVSWDPHGNSGSPMGFTAVDYLNSLSGYYEKNTIDCIGERHITRNPSTNFVISFIKDEYNQKRKSNSLNENPLIGFNYYDSMLLSMSAFFQDQG